MSENIYITLEEIRGLGIENLDRIFMEKYLEQAGQLTDPSQHANVWHPIKDVIGIVFFALLAGNDEWKKGLHFVHAFILEEGPFIPDTIMNEGALCHTGEARLFYLGNPHPIRANHIMVRGDGIGKHSPVSAEIVPFSSH